MADREFQHRLAAVLAQTWLDIRALWNRIPTAPWPHGMTPGKIVIKPNVADHSGNTVKLTGDGILVEFRRFRTQLIALLPCKVD